MYRQMLNGIIDDSHRCKLKSMLRICEGFLHKVMDIILRCLLAP